MLIRNIINYFRKFFTNNRNPNVDCYLDGCNNIYEY